MPHPIWAVLTAAVIAYAFTAIAKIGAFDLKDNKRTRDWQAELTGWRKRAFWAHQNSLEGFPFFATAVLAAIMLAPMSDLVAPLAWGYVVARIGYGYCYIKDLGRARSMVWFAGTIAIFGLLVTAGIAAS